MRGRALSAPWGPLLSLTQGEPRHPLRIRPLWTSQEILTHRRCSPGYFNTKSVAGSQSSRSRGFIHDGQKPLLLPRSPTGSVPARSPSPSRNAAPQPAGCPLFIKVRLLLGYPA